MTDTLLPPAASLTGIDADIKLWAPTREEGWSKGTEADKVGADD